MGALDWVVVPSCCKHALSKYLSWRAESYYNQIILGLTGLEYLWTASVLLIFFLDQQGQQNFANRTCMGHGRQQNVNDLEQQMGNSRQNITQEEIRNT
ncbi:hypothetical protein TNCV_4405121 [Trichonephila clavipes]|uniref:Uncharacterized protein n=1 Tax=Trichonephila clavipes TaxID=2585209 RepID=A0A8X6S711_TRICX|nr:hypothetical protein TNCV_4405121 [Trichonephila clavipes]